MTVSEVLLPITPASLASEMKLVGPTGHLPSSPVTAEAEPAPSETRVPLAAAVGAFRPPTGLVSRSGSAAAAMHCSARTSNAFTLPFASLSEPLWPSSHEAAAAVAAIGSEGEETYGDSVAAYEDLLGLSASTRIISAILPSPLRALPFWYRTCGQRKCIIYLEPRRNTPLYTAIEGFFRASSAMFGPTEAHQYHPHSSMTGFIDVDDGMLASQDMVSHHSVSSGCALAKIACHLDVLISSYKTEWHHHHHSNHHHHHKSSPHDNLVPTVQGIATSYDYPHKGTHKVDVRLDTPPAFRQIIDKVVEAFPEIHIRPKRIGHISLAYYNKHVKTDNLMSDQKASKLDSLARSFIYDSPDAAVLDPENNLWDIAFYELAFKSPVLSVPHRFNEIARWQL
ncbi:hypothetical protein GGI12_000194 [Dipsacomyces acuminosporus]|nr:hypothetical protein GGI12_000194 [Dipsacomyces acuminosporus]